MSSASTADHGIDPIDPDDLPAPGSTDYLSYGAGHHRPLLALSRPVGHFEVDLTTFKQGMPVLCNYIVKGKSHGWFRGIIHRIYHDQTADIDYDDGDYDYNVSFQNIRHLGVPKKRKFEVEYLPAPKAIVLSISHAQEAIAYAHRLVQAVSVSELSTPPHPMSPLSFSTSLELSSDDEVKFVTQGFSATRGSIERPIIL